MKKLYVTAFVALGLIGCQRYENVPPNDIGMMLTPTGYEDKVYTPGQVDIGQENATGFQNRLVLVQRSGFSIEEQFRGPGLSTQEGETDNDDHRCLTQDRAPMTLDVRLIFALPDYTTPEGKEDLARIFLLGNPKESRANTRVMEISAESIYREQAQIQVRPIIRQICAQYKDFETAFADFGKRGADGFGGKLESAIAQILKDQNVPFRLVSAMPSNMKPDQSVIESSAALYSAQKRNEAIGVVTTYLNQDPTGTRKYVYQMQTLQEIMNKGGGTNTMFMTDIGAANRVIPLPR